MKSETALQNEIRLELGKRKNIRIFRNNVGMINGVQFGLCVGSRFNRLSIHDNHT
jgi:hypothetical protein